MGPSDRPDGIPEEFGAQVVTCARDRLAQSGYAELGRILTTYRQGTLMLRGRLSSYDLKQVAQELVCRIEGVDGLVNQIEVRNTAGRGPMRARAIRPLPEVRPTPGKPGRAGLPTEG